MIGVRMLLANVDMDVDRVARIAAEVGDDVTCGPAPDRAGVIELELVTDQPDRAAAALAARTGGWLHGISTWPVLEEAQAGA